MSALPPSAPRTRIASLWIAVATLVVVVAGVAPSASAAGRMVVVFPEGDSATSSVVRVHGWLESLLAELGPGSVVDFHAALRPAPDTTLIERLQSARRAEAEAVELIRGQSYIEAAQKLRDSLRLLEQALPVVSALDYGRIHARLAGVLIVAGEPGIAQQAAHVAAQNDAARQLAAKTDLDRRALDLVEQARAEDASGARGTLSVLSQPEGARLLVGGLERCLTPCTVDRLPAGVQIVHIERAGYRTVVRLVDVGAATEQSIRARLEPTPAAEDLQTVFEDTRSDLGRDDSRIPAGLRKMLDEYGVARAVVVGVRGSQLTGWVFDRSLNVRRAKASLKMSWGNDEDGRTLLRPWLTELLLQADRPPDALRVGPRSNDPLDGIGSDEGRDDGPASSRSARRPSGRTDDEEPVARPRSSSPAARDRSPTPPRSSDPLDSIDE